MLLDVKLQSKNNTDVKDVSHSSLKSVIMETTWAMLKVLVTVMLTPVQNRHYIFNFSLLNIVAVLLESALL